MVEDMEMLRAQVAALEERLKVMEERMNAGSVAEVDVDVHHKSTKVEGKHDEDEDKDERKEGQVADEGNEAEVQDERQGVAHGVEDEKHEERRTSTTQVNEDEWLQLRSMRMNGYNSGRTEYSSRQFPC
ncbi:unnamed protein product [Cuscuta epithymum]|uniref:Uncharacterized protein n=1 Tax=Cuscuta epithymum TaxID=186058 RepID=A0AAV0D2D3_9ASTE|nr:unnamed protein product [Cuscuta epithymum]